MFPFIEKMTFHRKNFFFHKKIFSLTDFLLHGKVFSSLIEKCSSLSASVFHTKVVFFVERCSPHRNMFSTQKDVLPHTPCVSIHVETVKCIYIYCINVNVDTCICIYTYGVASVSRIDQSIGLFSTRAL